MPKTIFHLSDYPAILARFTIKPGPTPEDTLVSAPCCSRRTLACLIADVRDVPGTIVRGGGVQLAIDHDWLCDGCRARMFADGTWVESDLLKARGAPIHMVHWHRAREWEIEMRWQASQRGEGHQPDEAYELALEQITANHLRKAEDAAHEMVATDGIVPRDAIAAADADDIAVQRL